MVARQTATILVVEDDPGIAELEKTRLEDSGYHVRVAATADEALVELRRDKIELMLLDYRLPGGVDGLEFYARIRAAGIDPPVILVTGFGSEATVIRALRAGVRDFVTKSVTYLDYLPEAVERVLRQVRTEHLLAESEARLGGVIASAKDAIIVADANRRISLFNPAAERMFRCPAAEAVGQSLTRFIPDEPVPADAGAGRDDASLTRRLRTGSRGVRADGEEFPLEASVSRADVGGRKIYTVVVRDVTDRVRAERALRESEERFRLVTRATNDVVWDHDLRTNEVWISEAVGPAFGYLLGGARVGKAWWTDRLHPDDRDRVLAGIRAAVADCSPAAPAGGQHWTAEYRFRRADGAYAHVLDRGYIACDPTGRPVRMIGAMADITERVRAEEELRESQRFIQGIADATPYVLYLYDLAERRNVYCNRQISTVLGYTIEEVRGMGGGLFGSLVHPDDGGESPESIRRLAAAVNGEIIETEYRARHANGEWRWLRSRDTVFRRDPDGRPRVVLGTARDITDAKRAEERIREQAALIDNANDAILVRGPDDRIRFWNRGAERLYGWTAAEVLGRDANALLFRGPSAALDEARRVVAAEGAWAGEYSQVTRTGAEVIVASRWTLLRDGQGRPKGTLVLNTDVTERRHLEDQYRHAQRMESIGTLAGGVAHDFNNLLTVINGYSELYLESARPDDPSRGILLEVRKAGERAAGLTRQLLTFSRKQATAPRVFDLNKLVAETAKMLRRLIGEHVELTTHLDPGLGRVKADPVQVEQVVVNLAVNARDAMPGGGRLTIETRDADLGEDYARSRVGVRPGAYVVLAVADTGHGMDAATLARIFEPFFTTKEVGKGTGLGLATVHGIVTQAGGHIDVRSEPGRGTSFEVYLPRADGPAPDDSGPGSYAVARGTETVLLAEDEAGVRGLARVALQANGYAVLEAASGEEAVRLAESYAGDVHLLVTDMVMPRMSGRELAEQLVRTRPGLKVLFLSGYTEDTTIRQADDGGAAFLQKPFTPTVLARKVRDVLDG